MTSYVGTKYFFPRRFSSLMPMPRLGRSRTWPIDARTSNFDPRNLPIVRAFAGDSTMTSAGPSGFDARRDFPSGGASATADAVSVAADPASLLDFLAIGRGIVAVLFVHRSRNGNTRVRISHVVPKGRKASECRANSCRYPSPVTRHDLKTRTVGEILDAAFNVYRGQFVRL